MVSKILTLAVLVVALGLINAAALKEQKAFKDQKHDVAFNALLHSANYHHSFHGHEAGYPHYPHYYHHGSHSSSSESGSDSHSDSQSDSHSSGSSSEEHHLPIHHAHVHGQDFPYAN